MKFSQFEDRIEEQIKNKVYSNVTVNETIRYITSLVYPFHIKISYEPIKSAEKRKSTKIILSSIVGKCNPSIPLVQSCDGLIISLYSYDDKLQMRILARPPNCFKITGKKSGLKLENYDIYIAQDGTTITYYFDKIWRLSTKNGYHVNKLKWRGASYEKVISDVLKKYDFSLDKLSKDKSYTFGYRHPMHHPFCESIEAWFISAYDLFEEKYYPKNLDMGLPLQKITNLKSVKSMYHTCDMALDNYLKGENPCYGYILKASSGTSYFMESSLMSTIRRMLYNMPWCRLKDEILEEKIRFSDIRYVVLRNYLNVSESKTFIKLFPQFKDQYAFLDKKTKMCALHLVNPSKEIDEDCEALCRVLSVIVNKKCRFTSKFTKNDRRWFRCFLVYRLHWSR